MRAHLFLRSPGCTNIWLLLSPLCIELKNFCTVVDGDMALGNVANDTQTHGAFMNSWIICPQYKIPKRCLILICKISVPEALPLLWSNAPRFTSPVKISPNKMKLKHRKYYAVHKIAQSVNWAPIKRSIHFPWWCEGEVCEHGPMAQWTRVPRGITALWQFT